MIRLPPDKPTETTEEARPDVTKNETVTFILGTQGKNKHKRLEKQPIPSTHKNSTSSIENTMKLGELNTLK